MPLWLNRTALSGTSVAENGTASHTCAFAPAQSGNFLVAIVAGSINTVTPSGWTLTNSASFVSAVYIFTKTASAGESSVTFTHGSSNFSIKVVIYEFGAGTTCINSGGLTGQTPTQTGPSLSGLTGRYSRFTARSYSLNSAATTASCTWTMPTIKDYDSFTLSGANDGVELSIAYDDGVSGDTFTPVSTITTNSGYPSGEGIVFALSVVYPNNASGGWIGA